MTARDVRQFFDDVAEEYRDTEAGMRAHHAVTARVIETSVSGRVLCVGGLWSRADLNSLPPQVTAADLSVAMLGELPEGVSGVLGEARTLPLQSASFDHIVFPLILHHVTDNRGSSARTCVRHVLAEARRLLADGGSVWISEFCLNRFIYATQLLFSPATRALLAMVDTPLVVMHSARFFESALQTAGFTDVQILPIRPPQAGRLDTVRPVIGLLWFRVPRFLYPVAPTLINARVAAGGH